ncbi:hypothetical protein ACN47E_001121 [Coniothyrium glycines]
MAEDASNASQQAPPHIYRPIPRRTFIDTSSFQDAADSPTHAFSQSTPPSATENRRSSDFLAQLNARLLRTYNSRDDDADEQERPPARNKSFLNMTSSTLSGIYDELGSSTAGERSTMETPWGTGAETPAHSGMGMPAWETGLGSPDAGISMKNQARQRSANTPAQNQTKGHTSRPRHGAHKYIVIASKLAALYVFGIIYGLIVSQLHETRHLAAVHVEGVDRYSSGIYLASWGIFGVALGSLLPYVDLIWDGQRPTALSQGSEAERSDSPISEQINDVVRSVCAFVGIAFAIRRLPWQSTLQLTLTLALVNPALWYILDRSRPGLSLSLIVTSIATSFIFLHNPDALPSPPLPATTNVTRVMGSSKARSSNPTSSPELFAGMVSYENLAVVTWVGSVLFCSCVCFGSIGRRLGVLEGSGLKR